MLAWPVRTLPLHGVWVTISFCRDEVLQNVVNAVIRELVVEAANEPCSINVRLSCIHAELCHADKARDCCAQAYMAGCVAAAREYFVSGQPDEVAAALQELGRPELRHVFVKHVRRRPSLQLFEASFGMHAA